MKNTKAEALFNFLRECHAEDYAGLDDEMSDSLDNWISGLTDDELSDIVISTFREGL